MSDSPEKLPAIDPALSQLKEQTKNVMIPLLIKIFQIRLEAQQIQDPPSFLTNTQPKGSLDELITQLTQLSENLKVQQSWIQSCQTQVEKVLLELTEEPKTDPSSLASYINKEAEDNPAIKKSFQDALSTQKETSTFSWIKKILGI